MKPTGTSARITLRDGRTLTRKLYVYADTSQKDGCHGPMVRIPRHGWGFLPYQNEPKDYDRIIHYELV